MGCVALALPWLVLALAGTRRSRAFENQLPEVLDALAASLRAGHGFDSALQTVATDVAEPASREFRRVVAEVHLGRSLDDALAELGGRIRSEDLKFVLDAITIQRQIGGSLAELFELVAETVRSREQFRRKVKALTGMVRTSANVLTALPFVAALLLTSLNHDYMRPLWSTNGGHMMVAIGLGNDDLGDDHAAADRDGKGVTMLLLLLAGLRSPAPCSSSPTRSRRKDGVGPRRWRWCAGSPASLRTDGGSYRSGAATEALENVGRRFTTTKMRGAPAEPDRRRRARRAGDARVVRSAARRARSA